MKQSTIDKALSALDGMRGEIVPFESNYGDGLDKKDLLKVITIAKRKVRAAV